MSKVIPLIRLMIAVVTLIALGASNGQAQWRPKLPRIIDRMINDTSSAADARILAYPTAGLAPETGLEVGIRTFTLFHTKKDTVLNRLSEANLKVFVTQKRQFGVWLENAVYTNKNTYFFLGRVGYQQFPLLYYGIGPETSERNPALVNSNYFQLRQRILRRVYRNWYSGLEIDVQTLRRVRFVPEDPIGFQMPLGGQGSTTVGFGAAVVYDDRHNVLNVRKGQFLELGMLWYGRSYGSDFGYRSVVLDGRVYRPLGKTNRVIAAQLYGTFMNGTVPFNNLALLGGESLMRGYYIGRYRDKNLIVLQSELRWLPFRFSRRFGGTLFAGIGSVAPTIATFQADQFRWVGGGGLRFLLFPRKDVFIRGDIGITQEGKGFYVSLGEAF